MELPSDFRRRMKQQLGDAYAGFLATYSEERVCGLRYNPLKIKKESLVSFLRDSQIRLESVPWAEEGFYYPQQARPGKHPLHEAGAYYIQEPSAMSAAALLNPQPGERILDLCAAPGGKSTQIAGRMKGEGFLLANEAVPSRAKILSQNIERMGIANALVLNETPGRLAERYPLYFDRILVDAPCSGEGMFRKDERACMEWSLEQVERCAERQKEILSCAAVMLRPGGVLVYSTCTFSRQENEEIAEWLAAEYPQFTIEKQMHIWPHLHRGEGHYAARFRKEGTPALWNEEKEGHPQMPESRTGLYGKKGRGQKQTKEALVLLQQFLNDTLTDTSYHFNWQRIANGQLAAFGEQLYLLPGGVRNSDLDGLKTERAGLQLGCLKKNRFEPAHAFAMALSPAQVKRAWELPEPERYLRGEANNCGNIANGWVLATVHGCSLGWGKAVNGILKNHYPKGLRWQF